MNNQEIVSMKNSGSSVTQPLKNVNLTRKILKNIPLSDTCISIILGSILGDGSLKIHKNYKNARFKFRHSVIQREYFEWKVSALKEISSGNCIVVQKQDGFSKNQKLLYQSRALESLTTIYNVTSSHNNLDIKRSWLNHLTPLSLAIWWLDDGSLVSNRRKGVLCTDNFTEKSVNILSQYLFVVWGVSTRVTSISSNNREFATKAKYFRIWFSTTQLKKFLRIILPYIPTKSCVPKVLILYKDLDLQQRWISEVKNLLPKFK
uniref:Putative LAGLIDADG homing endonuclease n=1 Tax=Prasiolopsis wulf-kochii TaxID=3239232 RepID=A0A097KK34_9CHLO|nr:putative LAGLIDADG homing endonuclease [Prasiolopsis sp. SAG 84.81]